MKCSKCGTEYENSKFCPECGAPAQQDQPVQQSGYYHQSPPPVPPPPIGHPPKKKKRVGLIIVIIIVALVIVGVVGSQLGGGDKDTDKSTVSQAVGESKKAPESTPVEYIEVTATELITAYDENEVAADNAYKNKLLKITGTVGSIGKDIVDDAYITLEDERSEYTIVSVQCYFAKDNLDDIAELREGDKVTVVGKCTGGTLNVTIKECDIVE